MLTSSAQELNRPHDANHPKHSFCSEPNISDINYTQVIFIKPNGNKQLPYWIQYEDGVIRNAYPVGTIASYRCLDPGRQTVVGGNQQSVCNPSTVTWSGNAPQCGKI